MTSPLSIASIIMPKTDHGIAHGTGHAEAPHQVEDDRSSSLSEIGERADHDEAGNQFYDGSEANDTEAETERLEDSPQISRNYKDVVLTSTNSLYEARSGPLAMSDLPLMVANHGKSISIMSSPRRADCFIGLRSDTDRIEQTSEISSLADSGDDKAKLFSASPSTARKRKRSSFEQDKTSDQGLLPEPSTKATKILRHNSAAALVRNPSPSESAGDYNHEIVVDTAVLPADQKQLQEPPEPALTQRRYQRGKRKARSIRDDEPKNKDNGFVGEGGRAKQEDNQEAVYSNEEECENDDTVDVPGADSSVKNEEGVLQKRSAFYSLYAMEKFFATFRDKLFDERLSQYNEELAKLQSATPVHSDLVAMKDLIDQRRDQKLKYEQNLIKYKLQTLQRESIANKAQAHSQYMQTAREIRDSSLEKLNKEFYHLQRERRSVDGDVPDYMYEFSTQKSQQIKHQTAYNAEISILSGFAKYVGFPAAPEISKPKPKEVEDDLRSMGVSSKVTQAPHSHPQIPRARSTTSNFPRQRFGADEHFLEQNPWANPQHPSHHQQLQLHRQVSGLSPTATPSSTPAAQRRVVDLTKPQGSASTIPDYPSGPNSSMAASPATGKAVNVGQSNQVYAVNNHLHDSTPSRITVSSKDGTPANAGPFDVARDGGKGSHRGKLDRSHSPSLLQHLSHDSQSSKALPKPLPFLQTGGGSSSTPGLQTSTPGRYPIVKAEDPGHVSRHSPMPQYLTPSVGTVVNGQMTRFAR